MTSRELKKRALRFVKPLEVQEAMKWPEHVEAILAASPHLWHWYSEDMGKGRTVARMYNERFWRVALRSLAQNGPAGVVCI